ncbi:MAG: hypothetical protein P1U57_09825, partial [Oleibacter sp.]|nr:hypothetical protein [Thalassolituus sp.]
MIRKLAVALVCALLSPVVIAVILINLASDLMMSDGSALSMDTILASESLLIVLAIIAVLAFIVSLISAQ